MTPEQTCGRFPLGLNPSCGPSYGKPGRCRGWESQAEGSALGAAGSGAASPGPWPGPWPGQPCRGAVAAATAGGFAATGFAALGRSTRRQPKRFSSSSTTGRRYSLWHFGWQRRLAAGGLAAGLLAAAPGRSRPSRSNGPCSTASPARSSRPSRSRPASHSRPVPGSSPCGLAAATGSHVQPLPSNNSPMFPNRSRTGVGRQHFGTCRRPSRSRPAAAGLLAAARLRQQAGSGQQAFAHGWQQATLAQALHSPQPPQFSPSMRSRSSKPNPWLHKATLTRSAPKIVLLLIEQPLLYSELGLRKVGRYPQFIRCTAPGPSSHSLARFYPIRLPDAPSRHATTARAIG